MSKDQRDPQSIYIDKISGGIHIYNQCESLSPQEEGDASKSPTKKRPTSFMGILEALGGLKGEVEIARSESGIAVSLDGIHTIGDQVKDPFDFRAIIMSLLCTKEIPLSQRIASTETSQYTHTSPEYIGFKTKEGYHTACELNDHTPIKIPRFEAAGL